MIRGLRATGICGVLVKSGESEGKTPTLARRHTPTFTHYRKYHGWEEILDWLRVGEIRRFWSRIPSYMYIDRRWYIRSARSPVSIYRISRWSDGALIYPSFLQREGQLLLLYVLQIAHVSFSVTSISLGKTATTAQLLWCIPYKYILMNHAPLPLPIPKQVPDYWLTFHLSSHINIKPTSLLCGFPIGELWNLEELAKLCTEQDRYSFFFE